MVKYTYNELSRNVIMLTRVNNYLNGQVSQSFINSLKFCIVHLIIVFFKISFNRNKHNLVE